MLAPVQISFSISYESAAGAPESVVAISRPAPRQNSSNRPDHFQMPCRHCTCPGRPTVGAVAWKHNRTGRSLPLIVLLSGVTRWQPAVRSPRRSSLRHSLRPSPRDQHRWWRHGSARRQQRHRHRQCGKTVLPGPATLRSSPECGPTLVRDCGSRPDGSLAASRRSTRRCSFRPATLSAPGSPGWTRACCPRGCTRGRSRRTATRQAHRDRRGGRQRAQRGNGGSRWKPPKAATTPRAG